METIHGNLLLKTVERDLEISNGRVLVRLFVRDGGYVQEFSAVDREGVYQLLLSTLHKKLLTFSLHRSCSSPMIAGDRPHLFGVCRESLRMLYSAAQVESHDDNKIVVKLSGSFDKHSVECRITLEEGSSAAHIVVRDQIKANALVEYLMSSYAFLPGGEPLAINDELDYSWAPLLRPANDHVIGDCAFHAPAIIVAKDRMGAALVPDLQILGSNRPIPTALDLDIDNGVLFSPLLSYGFCDYEPTEDNRYCRHDVTMTRRVTTSQLEYGYHLILDATNGEDFVRRQANSLIWSRYNCGGLAPTPPPRALPLEPARSRVAPGPPTRSAHPHRMGCAKRAGKCRKHLFPARVQRQSLWWESEGEALGVDPHTGSHPQSGYAMLEVAKSCMELYESTSEAHHLKSGLDAMDQMCLLQSARSGLCVADNLGSGYNAELTAGFGACALKYGEVTGLSEYFERGVTAINAAAQAESDLAA